MFWVGYEWTLIVLVLLLASRWPLLWPIAVLFLGTRQQALGVLGHEQVHRTIDGTERYDTLANVLCMWPIGTDVDTFRGFHLAHHARLRQSTDPEVIERAAFPDRWTDLTRTKKARLLVEDCLGMHLDEVVELALRVDAGPSRPRRCYRVGIACVAFVGLGWPAVLAWVVALYTASFAAMRLRMWREHLGEEMTQSYVARWWERLLYLPHYIWEHEKHHRPGCWSIPCWELRKLEPVR